MAAVVREAIDRGVVDPEGRRLAAGRRVLEAPDMDVPDPVELKDELDALRARRA